jgi:hypothetical protein
VRTGALRKEFRERGYVVIDDFLLPNEISEILDSIETYRASGSEIIQVDNRDIIRTQIFKTIVGQNCEDHVVAFSDLWRTRIFEIAKDLVDCELFPINDPTIGINVNMTELSGELSFHYDRNEVTGILYLQACNGGFLEILPIHRILLPYRYYWCVKPIQRGFDVLWRSPVALWVAQRKRQFIEPRPGLLVIMRGPVTLHRVTPVQHGPVRIAGVFCYDKPETKWEKWNSGDNYVVMAKKKAAGRTAGGGTA